MYTDVSADGRRVDVTAKMFAIEVGEDEARTMRWVEVDKPTPGPGEVLLEVAATAVNRADLLQRIGRYPPPKGVTKVMGLEAAGRVAQLGEGVGDWQVGDEVCALLAGGGYAQYVVCPAAQLLRRPARLTLSEAAALPEAIFTAFLNLYLEKYHSQTAAVQDDFACFFRQFIEGGFDIETVVVGQ